MGIHLNHFLLLLLTLHFAVDFAVSEIFFEERFEGKQAMIFTPNSV